MAWSRSSSQVSSCPLVHGQVGTFYSWNRHGSMVAAGNLSIPSVSSPAGQIELEEARKRLYQAQQFAKKSRTEFSLVWNGHEPIPEPITVAREQWDTL